ncbi:ABC transporter ATP-binding protein [Bacteroidia bacterium]|nr:ABC transporter ATP-binding protein [Bacteroidia bacterium]
MLKIENYTAGYANSDYLFQEVSLEVLPAQVVGIKGTNGCGKSTFIKGLVNLTPIKKGTVSLNGTNISGWDTAKIFQTKQIGYLSQRDRIFGHLTVSENIQMYLYYSQDKKLPDSDISKKLLAIIDSKQNLLASTLSGGEQLILALYCLEILNPNVLLLDEPSDSLDSNFKTILIDLINCWKMSGKSILLVEQNIEMLNIVSNNILILRQYESYY